MRRSRKLPTDPTLEPLRVALTADATAQELSREAEALAAYRAVSWRRRRSLRRPAVLATKLGVATVAGVLGLSGVATAAYTGSLPDTLQDVAHKTINAPKAHPPAQAVGPDAKGDAAYGLCQAFAKDKEPKATPTHEPQGKGKGLGKNGADKGRGQSKQKSVAYRNLVRAAGGEDKVDAYCATVPKPSGEPDSSASPEHGKPTGKPGHPTGKPSDLPAPAQSAPAGSPSPLPTGSPTDLPTP